MRYRLAMWELHAVADRIMSFNAFRHHVYLFYLNVPSQRFGVNEAGEPEPPMLQQALNAQRRMDACGRSIMDALHAVFAEFQTRTQEFEYIVHL